MILIWGKIEILYHWAIEYENLLIFIILVLCRLQSANQFLKHHDSADHKI